MLSESILYELVKEKISLNQNIGKETAQMLMEGDIIVPDVKPDMAAMLKADAEVCFDRIDISNDRVNYFGKLNIKILYLAKGGEKSIHSIFVAAPTEDFINMDGVTKDMWVSVSANITNIEYKVLNDRKIGYRAVIEVCVTAEQKTEYEVISGITNLPAAQLKQGKLCVNRTIENKEDRFIIKDELSVPSGKPNVREILQSNITIANKEIKVISGKVNINGELLVSTLYKSDDEDSIVEFMEHEVPFNGAIDVYGADDSMVGDIVLKITDQYIQVRPNEDGEDRIIEIEISIGASVKVTEQCEISILEDAYCINKKLEYKRKFVNYPRLVCRNKNQYPVKEVIQITQDCPDMLQIYRVSGTAQLDEVKIIDDKVIVEGVINTDMLYIANNDDMPLYNYKTVLPYKQIIETKGAIPKMDVGVEIGIDHIGFNMLSEKEVELRFLLSFNTKVIDNMKSEVITDIEFLDIDKNVLDKMASMTIYIVQQGDSLWSIAKKYNVSFDDLLGLNELEDPNKIYPGQKLVIVKKIYE